MFPMQWQLLPRQSGVLKICFLTVAGTAGINLAGAIAGEIPAGSKAPEADIHLSAPSENPLAQVTAVSQLSDVQPTDWAFQALQSLVERYGCIAGYPDGTYRGNRALTRYEFAAGLNACLDRINELIAAGTADLATKEDLATLQRLQEEFAAELATLRGRVDALEARTTELEENQFSTTTKLAGEVAFNLADTFGDDDDTQTVFQDRIRLQFVSSFTGKDTLITRLTAGNIANSFADELETQEGRFAYDGQAGNDVSVDRLHYIFPATDQLEVTAMASLGGHHFYADTFNPGLEAGGGATGALSRFGERNPLYRFNLGGQGIGFRYQFNDQLEASAGYLARGGNNPDEGAGLFNGNYSALAQLVFKPSDSFKVGLTYLNGYDKAAFLGPAFFGGTGTNLGNFTDTLGLDVSAGVSSNSYGAELYWRVSSQFDVRGWFGLTKARIIGTGDGDILTYALILGFPDLGKEGNFGAIIVGAEPYLTDLDVAGDEPEFDEDIPLHVEALYKYRLNQNILITPGIIWLANPNQSDDSDDAIIGVLRTTFLF